MDNNGTLLTEELYGIIIDSLVKDVVRLKQEQGKSIGKINVEKETLKALKRQLKRLKENIKISKRTLSTERRNLNKINSTLNERNHSITSLNYDFISEEERTINLNEFNVEEPKRR